MQSRMTRLAGLWLLAAATTLATSFAATQATARDLPRVKPEAVGMSGPRLARVGAWLKAETAAGRIPGAVVLVARDGKVVYQESIGKLDPQKPDPMPADADLPHLFHDQADHHRGGDDPGGGGKLTLEAPVARYIPEFAKMQVGVEKTDAAGNKTLRTGAGTPPDHRAGPDAPYLWAHLRLFRQLAGEKGLCRRPHRRRRRHHQRGVRQEDRHHAAALPARQHLGLQLFDRRARAGGRGSGRQRVCSPS